ncbi:MAG: lysoplasmalogenase [Deltaproteobacteria bacterium]|nr:lysoplasmalogenase [Deltaproteobacteria bacterium]
MILFIVTILVIISAILHIHADHKKRRYQTYIFKPLTISLIILIGIIQSAEVSSVYRYLIVSGLAFALIGDIFLMLPSDRFLYGLFCFLVTHIFYIFAFISDSSFPINYLYLIPGLIAGVIILKLLLPNAGTKTVPVILYSIILVFLLWQAIGRIDESFTHSSIIAFVGTIFFIFSDVVLAFNRIVRNFAGAQLLILSTYYTAQLLIVYSV